MREKLALSVGPSESLEVRVPGPLLGLQVRPTMILRVSVTSNVRDLASGYITYDREASLLTLFLS